MSQIYLVVDMNKVYLCAEAMDILCTICMVPLSQVHVVTVVVNVAVDYWLVAPVATGYSTKENM